MIPFEQAVQVPAELGIELPQDLLELQQLYELMQAEGVRNFLEIGSRNGGSLSVLAQALGEYGVVQSVDLQDGPWGHTKSRQNLTRVMLWLEEQGYGTIMTWGDSKDPQVIEMVLDIMPEIDCVFIDGDHNYPGVKADWLNYGQHARICAFHDIAPHPGECITENKGRGVLGVHLLWEELKADGWDCRYEFITDPTRFGIGVVYPKETR